MLFSDFLKDIHEIGVWLAITIFGFIGLLIRTVFTNKAQIDLLKKELKERFEAREKHDEEIKNSLNKLENTVENTRDQILELWKQQMK